MVLDARIVKVFGKITISYYMILSVNFCTAITVEPPLCFGRSHMHLCRSGCMYVSMYARTHPTGGGLEGWSIYIFTYISISTVIYAYGVGRFIHIVNLNKFGCSYGIRAIHINCRIARNGAGRAAGRQAGEHCRPGLDQQVENTKQTQNPNFDRRHTLT